MRIGILGGGQLGRMLSLSAQPLGHSVTVLERATEVPASTCADVITAAYDDTDALLELARRSDVVTCEFESVPAESLACIVAAGVPVRPSPEAFRVASDRLLEKTMFRALGLATADFEAVDDADGFERALARIGLPSVLKTRKNGYDGKGQRLLRSRADADVAYRELAGVPLILEGFVSFRRELSIVAARSVAGDVAFYDVVENVHRDGILHTTTAPADAVRAETVDEARRAARAVLEHLDYVGVLALELFEEDDALRVNEMAPRVHNSGHFSIEGAATSQFENHIRAITGAPLGLTRLRGRCVMVNLVSTVPSMEALLAVPDAHVHLYGKEPKPGRKLGHVTVVEADASPVLALVPAPDAQP